MFDVLCWSGLGHRVIVFNTSHDKIAVELERVTGCWPHCDGIVLTLCTPRSDWVTDTLRSD